MRLAQCAFGIALLWLTTAAPYTGAAAEEALSPALRSCIEQMISIFEYESKVQKYDIVEDLDDGRGYTAGRSGFSTKDGDLLQVVQVYDRMRPNNVLSGFIPVLKQKQGTASTEGLEGLPAAWKEAATDPLFRQAQDQLNDELYYSPAMRVAGALGLRSPLAKFSVYDAIVQHGFGEDSDSLGGIVQAATSSAHGTPDQVGEEKWLMAFLTTRKEVLLNARDPTTRAGWRASIGRVDEQLRLLKEGNLQLSPPLRLNPYGTEFTVKCANRSSAPTSAPKKR